MNKQEEQLSCDKQGEPVAGEWVVLSESVGKLKELGWNDEAIHRANTPQRTWVGLTGNEREFLYKNHQPDCLSTLMDAVEALLKEKNT